MSDNQPGETTSATSQGKTEGGFPAVLRVMAFIALVIGVASSLIFMFHEDQSSLVFSWSFSQFGCLLLLLPCSGLIPFQNVDH